MEDGGGEVSASFFGWPEDREFVEKKKFWGILQHE